MFSQICKYIVHTFKDIDRKKAMEMNDFWNPNKQHLSALRKYAYANI